MLTVKEATGSAISYLNNIYPSSEISNILLEEVELSDDNLYWSITLSFSRKKPITSPLATLASTFLEYERVFKTFTIDTSNGNLKSMKIKSNE